MACEFVFLIGGECAVGEREELAESDDGVERGADFVAHILHEAGLGCVGKPHLLVGVLQLGNAGFVLFLVLFLEVDLQDGEQD